MTWRHGTLTGLWYASCSVTVIAEGRVADDLRRWVKLTRVIRPTREDSLAAVFVTEPKAIIIRETLAGLGGLADA